MPYYKGKTLAEALEVASIEENVDIQYLNYIVEKETETEVTVFTFFYSDIISFASNYVRQIIESLGIKVEIKSIFEHQIIKLKLNVSENSLLIGKDGVTLQALTTLARAAVAKEFHRHFHLLIDINAYKDRKYDRLLRGAREAAKSVQSSHIDVQLDPMTSDERRLIHNELSQFENIKTESVGEGRNRRIVIKYAGQVEPVAAPENLSSDADDEPAPVVEEAN